MGRRLPFAIWWESPELDDERAVEKGRIDLRFSHGYREKVYFAVECKRLNVMSAGKRRSLAMAYVEEGMMRFITGKYARSLDKGAMLGYVMDARVADAVEAVRHAVEPRRCQLQMPQRGSLVSSRFRSKAATVKETNHDVDEMAFLIYHIFVSCSYSIG